MKTRVWDILVDYGFGFEVVATEETFEEGYMTYLDYKNNVEEYGKGVVTLHSRIENTGN